MRDTICEHPACLAASKIEYHCKNHPNKRWFTKNIPGRTLFYNLKWDEKMGPECDCPGSTLEHIHADDPDATKWQQFPLT